jgi:hypothetical protein
VTIRAIEVLRAHGLLLVLLTQALGQPYVDVIHALVDASIFVPSSMDTSKRVKKCWRRTSSSAS